jgi:hypothetical protein
MANERDRIPADKKYLASLGRAAYNFVYLEWGIVWVWECIERGALSKVGKLTAGQIAKKFKEATSKRKIDCPFRSRLSTLSIDFEMIVKQRDSLLHANPYSAEVGEQRLMYNGRNERKDWPIDNINDVADRFAVLSIEAGDLLHGGLYAEYNFPKLTI